MEKDLEKGNHAHDAGADIENRLSEDEPVLTTTAADIDQSRCIHVGDEAWL
jgi:hypothetical protein